MRLQAEWLQDVLAYPLIYYPYFDILQFCTRWQGTDEAAPSSDCDSSFW